jgi:hypothetical protein
MAKKMLHERSGRFQMNFRHSAFRKSF